MEPGITYKEPRKIAINVAALSQYNLFLFTRRFAR